MPKIEHSVDVNVPAHVAYRQLARFAEFPRFMEGVQEVRQLDDSHLHWRTQHGDKVHEWVSELTEQIPDICIAWCNTSGRKNTGRVLLDAINPDCTRITMTMDIESDGDATDEVSQRAERDLSRFKKFVEHMQENPENKGGQIHDPMTAQIEKAGPVQSAAPFWLPGLLNLWEEPLYLMRRLSNEMDHFLAHFLRTSHDELQHASHIMSDWTPAIEIARRDNQLIISADLPGIRREDIQVEVRHDRVTIEGDRPDIGGPDIQVFHQSDRTYGHFYREIRLQEEVDSDAAAAIMDEGVLQITLPVISPAMQVKHLEIRSRN